MDILKKSNNDQKLTLILLTLNPEKIKKFIQNHSSSKIIILNGAKKEFLCNDFGNVIYAHMPGISYFERLKYGLSISKSEYSMIAGDDEFFNEKLIIDSINNGGGATMIFGKCLQHNGLMPRSFSHQYYKNPKGIKRLKNKDLEDVDVYLSLLKEDTVYWYAAVKNSVLKHFANQFNSDREMAEFEITLPFYVLKQIGGEIKYVDDVWMKRAKYTKISKPSDLEEFIHINNYTPLERLAINAKRLSYVESRGETNHTFKIIKKSLIRKILYLMNKFKLIHIDYKFDV